METDIVITGAAGVVGRRAVRALVADGHRAAGVVRSPRGRRLVESLGARAVDADVFDPDSLTSAFTGADAAFLHADGGDTVVLRFGLFVAPDGDLTRSDVENARAGISPSLGARVCSRRLHEASGWTPRVRGGTDGWQRIAQWPLAA